MKDKFQQIIYRLFTASFCTYVSNWDDMNEGFEFNPNSSRLLVQIRFTMDEIQPNEFQKNISIEVYSMNLSECRLSHRDIIHGKVLLLPDGQVDYDFYEKILKNLSNF